MTPSTRPGRITLGQAHAAAWAGDLDRAARLLDDLDAAMLSSPASLDLRARIHAQRGDLDNADTCWARVLLLHPEDPEATAGRATIARIRAGRPARPLLTAGRVAVLAAVLVTAAAADLAWIHYGDGDPRLYADTASGYFYMFYGSRIVDKTGSDAEHDAMGMLEGEWTAYLNRTQASRPGL